MSIHIAAHCSQQLVQRPCQSNVGNDMQDQSGAQIIIRHVGGAKINKIDQFRLGSTEEISFGRDASSSVNYDSPKDDVVSRKHAVIRVNSTDPPSFLLEDLKSSNGTYVNGTKITSEMELFPDDIVEFGSGGPKFSFDIQPRPPGLAARTRVMSMMETNKTRAVGATSTTDAPSTQKLTPPPKIGVGKNTVQVMLQEERKKTSQVWIGALLAIALLGGLGGGWLFWSGHNTTQQLTQQLQQDVEESNQRTERRFSQQTQLAGMSPGDVVSKYGSSVVVIEYSWRLYDKETGRPVYHKRWYMKNTREWRPAYIWFEDGSVVPWLTTEDEGNSNYEVRGAGSASGIVVNAQGFIITNKHVAASWMFRVAPEDYLPTNVASKGVVLKSGRRFGIQEDEVTDEQFEKLKKWIPEENGGILWASAITNERSPRLPRKNTTHTPFLGRNETLDVLFPGSPVAIKANLIRTSNDSDVALIKIDSPDPLQYVELSPDDEVKIGEKVVVLGYPTVSKNTFQINTSELGKDRIEYIPQPTVTDGLVASLGTERVHQGNRELLGLLGDYIELSVVATGRGNSGGPVFNSAGKVIGLFSALSTRDGARMSFAVPIKHGRDLLKLQKAL
jgi:serine protease Do